MIGPADVARFLVLGRAAPSATRGGRHESLLVGLDDKPGRPRRSARAAGGGRAQSAAGSPSRPTDRRGLRDLFFVDLDGHRDEPACRAVLERLASDLPLLKVLGSYPRDGSGGRA